MKDSKKKYQKFGAGVKRIIELCPNCHAMKTRKKG